MREHRSAKARTSARPDNVVDFPRKHPTRFPLHILPWLDLYSAARGHEGALELIAELMRQFPDRERQR